MKTKNSPYLKSNDRLADVIAAIQVLGTYKFYMLDFAGWSERISGDNSLEEHWKTVFVEHPEFFRLDSKRERASLVWRRQHQKLFNVDREEKISKGEYENLTKKEKERITRTPLTSSEISTLINTAIDLHSRALSQKQDTRWWISGVVGLLGVILGASIKALAG